MKFRILILSFFSLTLFWGCQKWGEPEFNANEWTPPEGTVANQFWTIRHDNPNNLRNILGRHAEGTPPDSIVNSFANKSLRYVRAVVVSTDEGGNYYKSLTIQDATGGVELQLDMPGLYTMYPVGQKIVLICNGLYVGDYGHLPQVGWLYNDGVGRINSLFFDQHIIKDGIPSPNNLPKPLTNSQKDFLDKKNLNTLVRLEGVTFQKEAIGEPFAYNDIEPATEWIVYVPMEDGNKQEVRVRTSNYAKFRSLKIEDKEYNLTGILTYYRPNYQLMIRTKDDIEWKSN